MDKNRLLELAGITEGQVSSYEDSLEFTNEMYEAAELLKKFNAIVTQQRWKQWMKDTDDNFSGTHCVLFQRSVEKEVKSLKDTFNKLVDMLERAGEE